MTKDKAKDVDHLIKAAFDLPAPEMPNVFDEVIELTDEDMEYLAAAKHNSMDVSVNKI
ncbi:MAG: hypothetical protein MJ250_08075 [Alphaproteobacteria bacterium]|nr:hypothetical protein [Alphaproteobacteria bacterium]